MRLSVVASLLVVGMVSSALAAPACFRRPEAVADQGIRYMTEVMVMSDTCRDETYARFAYRNRDVLQTYQHALMDRFKREGGSGQAKLDTFMTHIANEAALRTGARDIAQVCAVAVQFLATADRLSGDAFRQYIEQQTDQRAADYKICK